MILDKITEYKIKKVNDLKKKKASLIEKLKKPGITLIAEIKKASPSKGVIARDFDPYRQLTQYEKAGAGAISILTDKKFFQGSNKLLESLRPHTKLPLLRKDFIIDPLQIYESCLIGADVILLIAAILNKQKIYRYLELARKLGREVIVEVHNLQELKMVLDTPVTIIGINNRNLKDFSVDLQTTEKLLNSLTNLTNRKDYCIIAESGIKNKSDVDYLKKSGVDGVLIGETLMKAANPFQKIRELLA